MHRLRSRRHACPSALCPRWLPSALPHLVRAAPRSRAARRTDESPRSAAAPSSGRRACRRVACGPCAQVTVTAADCGGAALGRTARKVTEDSNEAKKKHDEARAKLQEVGPTGCPRRAAPVSSRVACCVLHSQRLSRLRPGPWPAPRHCTGCALAWGRREVVCMGTLGPYTPQPDRAGAVRQQTCVACRLPCLLHVARCTLHVTRAGDQRQAAVRERGGRGQAR
jgi:hypothetical protein